MAVTVPEVRGLVTGRDISQTEFCIVRRSTPEVWRFLRIQLTFGQGNATLGVQCFPGPQQLTGTHVKTAGNA